MQDPFATRPTRAVLGVAGSARREGSSDLLLAAALAGARSLGARTMHKVVAEHAVHPCRACDACRITGRCVIDDEAPPIYDTLQAAHALVMASPVYFSGLPAQLKALMDRGQARYWQWEAAGRPQGTRPALLLLVGARHDTERVLTCVRRTLGGWLPVVGYYLWNAAAVPRVESAASLPEARLTEAHQLGHQLAAEASRRPQSPGSESPSKP